MLRAPCRRFLSAIVALPLIAGLVLVPSVAAHATFPGLNGRIAFDDFYTGQIYSVNPDGTGLVQLTHLRDGKFAAWPHWSPDGKHIAFASDMGGSHSRVWVMDADGRNRRMVVGDRPQVSDLSPNYTPDGEWLVFSRCRPDPPGGCALFSVRIDGTHRHALTPFRPDVIDYGSSVSPGGGRIAFARFNANGISSQVYVMRIDGSGAHPVTAAALEAHGPNWSPDARRISFSSACCRLDSNVYSMNTDGSELRHLTDTAFPHNGDLESAYSPRGDRIVFDSDRRYSDLCCADLFVMRTNGTGETFVHTGLTGVENPSWGTAPLVDARSGTATSVALAPAGPRISRGDSAWCWMLPTPVRAKPGCAEVSRAANTAGREP